MKYSQLSPAPKLTVRRASAVAMFDHEGVFNRLEKHGWIAPLAIELPAHRDRSPVALFLVTELTAAAARLKTEKLPL